MNRRKLVLAILLAIFAVAVVTSFLRQPSQKTVAKLKYTTGMTANISRTGQVRDETRLHLDLLDKELPHFSGTQRNIFRPIFSAENKSSLGPRKMAKLALPVPPPPRPPLPPPVAPSPAQLAMEDVSRFTFLGFLQKENRKTIFLSRDNEIILVKKGDTIAGKYQVTSITDEAMTISLRANGEQIIIPLMENRPLSAASANDQRLRR